jgi:carbon-monoxide dehydrogenase small subunit
VAHVHRDGLPAPGNCGQRTLVGRTPAGAGAVEAAGAAEIAAPGDHPAEIALPTGEPTITVDVTSQLESAPDEVARVFHDIRLLARCLPGAELTDELGDDWYRGRARIALGPVRLSFDGVAHVLEQRDDRIVLKAQGKDTGGGGAQAEIVMSATPSGTGVSLHAQASVFLTGRIASFGRSLAGDVSRRMFEDFARGMDRAAAGEEPDVTARPPGAMAILLGALSDRARARLRTVRQRRRDRTPRRDRRRTPSRDER